MNYYSIQNEMVFLKLFIIIMAGKAHYEEL